VTNMSVWGNHSATQYPDITHAKIKATEASPARSASEAIADQAWVEQDFIPTVQKRGAAIIEARGASSAASAANAAIEHVHDWAKGTASGDWVSMAVPSDGSYGIAEGIFAGHPCTCSDGEWSIVQGLEIDDFSRARIDASIQELREERQAVQDLGLI
jgi:malate dehydrogenase